MQPTDRKRALPPDRSTVRTGGPRLAASPSPHPGSAPPLDEPTQRRLAVNAFAVGVGTRQIENLLRVILDEDNPDHSSIVSVRPNQPVRMIASIPEPRSVVPNWPA